MSGLIEWIKRNDRDQQDWAVGYLYRKGVSPNPNPPNPYEYFICLENSHKNNPAYTLAISSMKAAWRQKKLREKRKGKTEFSLVISNEKKRKLSTLAQQRGKALGETLEELIDDELARNEEHREKVKKEKKSLEQRLYTVRESHKNTVKEIELTTHVLLYLLQENLIKMIQCEVDAFKANHSSIHEHIGSNEYKNKRFSAESEVIKKALEKVPSWDPKTFPLHPITQSNIKKLLSGKKYKSGRQ